MSRNEIITVVVIAAFIALLVWVWLRDRKAKRNGEHQAASGMVSVFNEAFQPQAARAAEIREVQQELPAQAPIPGDLPRSGERQPPRVD